MDSQDSKLITGAYAKLKDKLAAFIPAARLVSDPLRTMAYGTDASFYRLNPKLVVEVVDEAEVIKCLQLARELQTPVTFRAAGTSLSGQAITDSVLLRLGWGWRQYSISDDGSKIRLQPDAKLQNIAKACAERVIVPDGVTCCSWAGDKGFTQPELNDSALHNLKPALTEDCEAGYSTSRTCEIGLSYHSGLYYRSIVYLVNQCSDAKH